METGTILDALARQARCYLSMLEISRRERDLIESHFVPARWLELLRQKNAYMREAGRIEREIAPLKAVWRSRGAGAASAPESEVHRRLATLKALLSELIEADRENERLLALGGRQVAFSAAPGAIG